MKYIYILFYILALGGIFSLTFYNFFYLKETPKIIHKLGIRSPGFIKRVLWGNLFYSLLSLFFGVYLVISLLEGI